MKKYVLQKKKKRAALYACMSFADRWVGAHFCFENEAGDIKKNYEQTDATCDGDDVLKPNESVFGFVFRFSLMEGRKESQFLE